MRGPGGGASLEVLRRTVDEPKLRGLLATPAYATPSAHLSAHKACISHSSSLLTNKAISCDRGLVAGHPEVQRRIADELDSRGLLATAANPTPRRPRHEDLARLPYLDAVLRESFRVLPVSAVGMQRVTSAPVTDLGGYAVPANTEVLVRLENVESMTKEIYIGIKTRMTADTHPAPASVAPLLTWMQKAWCACKSESL